MRSRARRPNAAREPARGVGGHALPENFESVDDISCILRHFKHAFVPFIYLPF